MAIIVRIVIGPVAVGILLLGAFARMLQMLLAAYPTQTVAPVGVC
jgi:hypothetical protein